MRTKAHVVLKALRTLDRAASAREIAKLANLSTRTVATILAKREDVYRDRSREVTTYSFKPIPGDRVEAIA